MFRANLLPVTGLTFFLAASSWLIADEPRLADSQRSVALDLFEKKIRPALIKYCYECHSETADDLGGELLVDSRDGLLRGGETGPAIVSGKPQASLLMRAIAYDGLEMPPDQRMPETVIADFRRWIAMGAVDPRKSPSSPTKRESDEPTVVVEPLWSLQPIKRSPIPVVADPNWPRGDVDRFILAKLEENGLKPVGDAAPSTLIRRVYFDLIGLPPPPDVVASFNADPSPQSLASVVDQLLATRAFGERWARHWLDVARYGESMGSSRDVLMLYAYRYRDYVIDAISRDVPFDRFITEQIAGDLLDADDDAERERLIVATGLLAVGSKSLNGGNLTYDVIDDQIDVVCKSVLGLTVSCARCHDHKFDPIPTADYYSLAGIFLSTETRYGGGTNRPKSAKDKQKVYLTLGRDVDPATAKSSAAAQAAVDDLQKQVQSSLRRVASLEPSVPAEFRKKPEATIPDDFKPDVATAIRKYQGSLRVLGQREAALAEATSKLGDEPDYAIGVQEAAKITDGQILIRGEKNERGETVRRGFLTATEPVIVSQRSLADSIDTQESGRRQLAAWLVDPSQPLTPRVAVNRIWQHLMGAGIVETVDNFGVTGTPPSHPELLDELAYRFVHHHGWSTKSMIRELVLSRTYQLASSFDPECFTADPANRLRWRMTRRRLEAEPLRDAMLAVSGLLRTEPLSGSLVLAIGEGEVGRNINTKVLDEPMDHRSVYLPIIRGLVPESLQVFDFPEPSNVQGQRDSNTTPTQSLYLMNSAFVIRAARAFAGELIAASSVDQERVTEAHRRCFGQEPAPEQISQAIAFIDEIIQSGDGKDAVLQAWTAYCQTLMASAPFRLID